LDENNRSGTKGYGLDMNNREIRDALASVFLEVELNVRVKHARSTNSVYLTVSNSDTSYIIRIANHNGSPRFSKIYDSWIDTSKKNVVPYINSAIQCAAHRFGISIKEVVPEEKPEEPVSEEVVQSPDIGIKPIAQNFISLAQYYVKMGGLMPELNNDPDQDISPIEELKSDSGDALKFIFGLLIILAIIYLIK
jgi:hypothetical protein